MGLLVTGASSNRRKRRRSSRNDPDDDVVDVTSLSALDVAEINRRKRIMKRKDEVRKKINN